MKNILSGQTGDTTKTTTCAGGQGIPPPSLQQVCLKKKNRCSSCILKISGDPPEASGVSSQWHRVFAWRLKGAAIAAPLQHFWPMKRKSSKKTTQSLLCRLVHSACVDQGSGEANTSRRCNQSQRTCSAPPSSALGVPWAGLRSEPLR